MDNIDDLPPDSALVDDPIASTTNTDDLPPDPVLVDDPITSTSQADDPHPNPAAVDNPISPTSCADDSLPEPALVNNPLDNPFDTNDHLPDPVLAVDNPLTKPLTDSMLTSQANNPLPDPALEVDDPLTKPLMDSMLASQANDPLPDPAPAVDTLWTNNSLSGLDPVQLNNPLSHVSGTSAYPTEKENIPPKIHHVQTVENPLYILFLILLLRNLTRHSYPQVNEHVEGVRCYHTNTSAHARQGGNQTQEKHCQEFHQVNKLRRQGRKGSTRHQDKVSPRQFT